MAKPQPPRAHVAALPRGCAPAQVPQHRVFKPRHDRQGWSAPPELPLTAHCRRLQGRMAPRTRLQTEQGKLKLLQLPDGCLEKIVGLAAQGSWKER